MNCTLRKWITVRKRGGEVKKFLTPERERGRGRGLARGGAPAPFLEGRGTAVWGESLGFWGLGVQGGGSARLGALTAFLRGKPAVWGEMLRFWGVGGLEKRAQLALDPTPRSCSDLG